MRVLTLTRLTRLTTITLGLAAIVAPAASRADTVPLRAHAGDQATLTLTPHTTRALTVRGVRLAVGRPGTKRQSQYLFPQKSGQWNFADATGSLSFNGALSVGVAGQSLKFVSLTFTRAGSGKGAVMVSSGRQRFELLAISGRAHVNRTGARETVSGLRAVVAKSAAKLIDRRLYRQIWRTGQLIGSFQITATNPGQAKTGSQTTGQAADGVGLAFSNEFSRLPGLSVAPTAPASPGLPGALGSTVIPGTDGNSLTLPVAGGATTTSFDRGTLNGTIPLGGGATLADGHASAALTNPQLTLGTGTEGSALSFSVNGGPETKLFSIDSSELEQSTAPNGSLDLKGLSATLSSEGAASLNSALGMPLFTTGQAVGGLTVVLPANPPPGG